jgi:hypothetical protein
MGHTLLQFRSQVATSGMVVWAEKPGLRCFLAESVLNGILFKKTAGNRGGLCNNVQVSLCLRHCVTENSIASSSRMMWPRCPVCDYLFKSWEINFDSWLGRRKVVPCVKCSTLLSWDARWYRVLRIGCWMAIFSILCMTVTLFDVKLPRVVGFAAATGFVGGTTFFVIGAICTKLAVVDE